MFKTAAARRTRRGLLQPAESRALVRPVRGVFLVLAAATALVAASGANASHGAPPWTGGAGVTSPLEARLAAIQTELARRPASAAHCPTPDEWVAVATAYGDDPVQLLGFVPFDDASPTGTANAAFYNPLVCSFADEFLARPARIGQKACQTGTRTEYKTTYRTVRYRALVRKRVMTASGWKWKNVRVWKTKRVARRTPVKVPVYSLCEDYELTLIALSTVAHETGHVWGITVEPAAECFAVQTTSMVAALLGAPEPFAVEVGKDFLTMYEASKDDASTYWHPDCRDGGLWDLWPTRTGWPTPTGTSASTAPSAAATSWATAEASGRVVASSWSSAWTTAAASSGLE